MSSVPPPNWQPQSMPAPQPPEPAPVRRVRPKLLAIACAAVIAGAAFVLVGSSSSKLGDPVANAATLSSNAAGYRMHMSLEFSSTGVPPVTGVVDGSVDVRDHLASMSMALSLSGNPAAAQALGTNTLKIDEILDGPTVYMKLPAAATRALRAAGKEWTKVDLSAISHMPGLSSIESNPATNDPSQVLKSLRAVSSSIVTQGRQRVDGVETTLYHANLNLDQIAKALPAADQAVARGALEQALGVRALPIDIWIDASHLVRRMRMTFDTTLPDGQTVSLGMTAELSDYGPQPRPALPPAGDVQDVSALATAAAGQ